jgi:hypothetical protein
MKQTSRRSFFSLLAGATLIGAPGAALIGAPGRARASAQQLALVCHRLAWEDGHGGQAEGQFRSIAAARKAGWPDDKIIVPPSHIEPSEGDHWWETK